MKGTIHDDKSRAVKASSPSQADPAETFTRDTVGLAEASESVSIDLREGDVYELAVMPVAKRLGDATVRMLAYNGSVPGPTLRVKQGSEVVVKVTNHGDMEATVHWHGLRLNNRFDGVPYETQPPIPIGGEFSYRVQFPDAGVYWYHPHIREDYGLEMGLYGNIVVEPADPNYWSPVNRELVLTLDDILLEDGRIAPFSRSNATHTAMGRYGNLMLIGGELDLRVAAQAGETVRLFLTNTANARVFGIWLPGARMKLAGGDSGRYERQEFVQDVVLGPSQRAVVDVLFEHSGTLALEHRTPDRTYRLAQIAVSGTAAARSYVREFETLRDDIDLAAERDHLGHWLDSAPDKTLAFVAEMDDVGAPSDGDGKATYSCPMHPEVVSDTPGRCPKCGMKLLATLAAAAVAYACPMHPEVTSGAPGRCPKCGMELVPTVPISPEPGMWVCPMHPEITSDKPGFCPKCGMELVPVKATSAEARYACPMHPEVTASEPSFCPKCGMQLVLTPSDHSGANGIEWEDDMVDVNRATTPANFRWKLRDTSANAENHEINWRFRVGDRVKIRPVNEMDSDHPMHHPFHIHGAGRFLVLARDGAVEPNLVWSDTVLVRKGQVVDILLDVTNPGLWMAHCHIAEHIQSGMMFRFRVDPPGGSGPNALASGAGYEGR